MAVRKQNSKPIQTERHLSTMWVSYLAVPRAYMKWIQYDSDSQYINQGYIPITNEAKDSYQLLELEKIADQDGFVQFFVANESLHDVCFADMSATIRRPIIIQEGHYNPFGLPLAGLTTLGNPEYAYFFTGKELYEDEALQWYDYGARMYDVQIGRWTTHDPEYQLDSPYDYCAGNPVNNIDPDGRLVWFIPIALAVVGAYVGGSIANETANPIKWDYSSDKTRVGIGIGAVLGFGAGFGISQGLSAAGITTGKGLSTALGLSKATCPGFALNGYAATQLAPAAWTATSVTLGTSAVAAGGTGAYYNIPGFADGLSSTLSAIGKGVAWTGEQVALAAAGGGNTLAQVLTMPQYMPIPTFPFYFVLGGYMVWQAGQLYWENPDATPDGVASWLEKLGVPRDYLRGYYAPPKYLPGFPDAIDLGKPY